MNIETLNKKNLISVVDFLNTSMVFDDFSPKTLKAQSIDDPDFEPGLGIIAMNKKIEGFVLGVRRGDSAAIKMFSINDNKRSESIGTCLIKTLETRLVERGVAKIKVGGGVSPRYFQPGIDPRYTAAVSILLKNGYKIDSFAQNMKVDIVRANIDSSEEEEKLKNAGIFVKRLTKKDQKIFMHYLKDWDISWFYSGMLAYENDPVSCFIALKDRQVVGFACYNITNDNFFGPIGVSSEMRGSGVGKTLLKRSLQDMKALGNKTSTICAVGPVYFYWKTVGARIPRVLWIMSKELKQLRKN